MQITEKLASSSVHTLVFSISKLCFQKVGFGNIKYHRRLVNISEKHNAIISIAGKSVEGGNLLYKNENFSEAREVYARALNHVGEKVTSQQEGDNAPATLQGHLRDLTTVLLLGLSRCARKLNDLNTGNNSNDDHNH